MHIFHTYFAIFGRKKIFLENPAPSVFRRREKKPYGITLITCNSTLVYIIDYLRGPVSGNFDVKIDVIEIVIIDGDCY